MTLLLSACAEPPEHRWRVHRLDTSQGNVAGAIVYDGGLLIWGNDLQRILLPDGRRQELARGVFLSPGCLSDVNQDAVEDLVLLQAPDRMVWRAGPDFRLSYEIDRGVRFSDCLGVEMFGRRGIVVNPLGMQIRFYFLEHGKHGSPAAWQALQIYSFYTASYQGGLLSGDIDGDGRPDLLCGNYWLRAPERFGLPWRLFAINTLSDLPASAWATMRFLSLGEPSALALVWGQGRLAPGRLSIFLPPGDPRLLWLEKRLDGDWRLRQPAAVEIADLDGDGRQDIIVGESATVDARVIWFRQRKPSLWDSQMLARGVAARKLWTTDVNRDGLTDVVVVSPQEVLWLEQPQLQ